MEVGVVGISFICDTTSKKDESFVPTAISNLIADVESKDYGLSRA